MDFHEEDFNDGGAWNEQMTCRLQFSGLELQKHYTKCDICSTDLLIYI